MRRLDPYAMLDEMPAWLLNKWEGFYRIEPWGQPAEDWRHAVRCAIACGSKQPEKFLHKSGVRVVTTRRQTPEEQREALRSI